MAKQKKAVPQYQIHNTVRKVEGRLTRAKLARRTRMNMLLGGGLLRIPRGRHVTVAEPLVRQLLGELTQLEIEGALKVTTPDGRRVDLQTLKPFEAPKATASPVQKPLDSAAGDKTFEHGVGEGKPQMLGGKAQSEDVKFPEVLNTQIPEGAEDLDAIAQEVYDAFSKADLVEMAAEYEVEDTTGNKMDVAKRLVAAGLRMENGD